MEWVVENEAWIGIVLQAVMAVIWIAYLQVFVLGYIRQRRPLVLINRGAGVGTGAQCLVCNMGGEPIYLTSVIADLRIGDETFRAFVTDREEVDKTTLSRPSEGTNQGPIGSGEFVDIGSFDQILERALRHVGRDDEIDRVDRMDLTVLCGSGHSMLLVAGRRRFIVGWADGDRRFVPNMALTEQITRRRDRRRLREVLEKSLREEAGNLKTASDPR
ncbi:hypothetical protein LX81_02364 [Palleronia aestuarii]|uniref:Uncharacterized protein n=1 Tax=Palleronia aestuarii TaxID=568105 RepID=A0A2W7NWW0_9RHOB|nr:hypothetical protein [Palleronia aestuarii]PZX15732.1 hypothetical protein LX81_02364 [Palleronia aestuarii]